MMAASLSDLVVVITGAARGIGRAAAEQFLARDARVVALDRSWEGAEDTAAALESTGRALVTAAEITDPDSVAASCRLALDRFGQVDVLINNAACRQRYFSRLTGWRPSLRRKKRTGTPCWGSTCSER
jgi:NAD(P)-dependent dehydrogenase (short-subunit alcohol dehydrogenase family)